MRINSTAILKALPIQGIESEWLASVDLGLETEKENWARPVVRFCEPPAGGTRMPYVAAVETICLIYCVLLPESTLVAFLLEVAGIANVDTLKSGLIDPSNYTHPFEMNQIWTSGLPMRHFHYPSMSEDGRRDASS